MTRKTRKPEHLTQMLGIHPVPSVREIREVNGVLFAYVIEAGKMHALPVAQHLANAGIPVRVR